MKKLQDAIIAATPKPAFAKGGFVVPSDNLIIGDDREGAIIPLTDDFMKQIENYNNGEPIVLTVGTHKEIEAFNENCKR